MEGNNQKIIENKQIKNNCAFKIIKGPKRTVQRLTI